MNKNSLILVIALLFLQLLDPTQVFGQTFPLKLSSNGRHLVDQDNKPFLINGDTPWQIVYKLTMEEIEDYLDNRKAKKMNTIQIQLISFDDINGTNREGVRPFVDPADFTVRNETYFDFVAQVLKAAKDRGIAVIIAPAWQGSPNAKDSVTWRPWLRVNGTEKSKSFGNYLGTRFNTSQYPNIIAWMMGGDNKLDYTYPYYKAMAEGIRDKDAKVFLTYHLSAGQASSDEVKDDWLNFNSTYCYFPTHPGRSRRHVYDLSHHAYKRSPIMPFYLSESLYEGPKQTNIWDQASAAFVRRQAYWSILGGSAGHIYGAVLWSFRDTNWIKNMDLPGAFNVTHLSNFFNRFDWYKLVPVIDNTFVTAGYGTYDGFTAAGDDYVASALTSDGKVGIAYLPSTGTTARTITVNMTKLKGTVAAKWFNPNTGVFATISESPFANSGKINFTTPGNNGDKANDWILFLESK